MLDLETFALKMAQTDNIDNDFAPIRKSNVSVKYGEIIQDIKIDHDQSNVLKNLLLMSSKKKRKTQVYSPQHTTGRMNTQQNSNKIQKNTRINPNPLSVELVEPEKQVEKKVDSNRVKIPLFRGIIKPKQNKITKSKQNEFTKSNDKLKIKDTVSPLILNSKESNYTSHFMNMLKITLLSQSSAYSTTKIPNYFRSTCQLIDEILDNGLKFNKLKEIILLKSHFSHSNQLFERYLIDVSKIKWNCQIIKVKLPFDQDNNSIDQINEEFVYRGYDKPLRMHNPTNKAENKHVPNHIDDASSIKQSMQQLIETVNDKNKRNTESNGMLFTFDEINESQLSTVDTYLAAIHDIIPRYELPVIITYNQLETNEYQELPKHLLQTATIEAQKLKDFPSFKEEIIALLYVDTKLTNTECHSNEWNQKIRDILSDPTSRLYNELEKVYIDGKGPLDGITMILNLISKFTSLKETLNILGKEVE